MDWIQFIILVIIIFVINDLWWKRSVSQGRYIEEIHSILSETKGYIKDSKKYEREVLIERMQWIEKWLENNSEALKQDRPVIKAASELWIEEYKILSDKYKKLTEFSTLPQSDNY